jgi:hypothetical protein
VFIQLRVFEHVSVSETDFCYVDKFTILHVTPQLNKHVVTARASVLH